MYPQIFGKYVLEREIAAGGMARVYLATLRGAVGFEKRLVVKQIRTELASDEAFVTRFVEEAKTAVELSHPNIVPVYELGVEQGVYYIAMELCEGLTLSEVLAETGPLGPAEGAYLGVEICRALDYAHRRAQIVHRDVTPRNVLIDDEGAVRLIDFGIATPVTNEGAERSEVFGSPGHMPPEQLHGAELTPATDVFAVGVLLLEAWTGQAPFRRATAHESELALFNVPQPLEALLPELAPLSALIASSVSLDARDRPAGAEQLARPLREFLKSEDSGDIARRLSARVQRARSRAQSSSPRLAGESEARTHTPTTRLASGGGHQNGRTPTTAKATRTFAARSDLEVWTRRLSNAPSQAAPARVSTSESVVASVNQPASLPAAPTFANRRSGSWSSKLSRPPAPASGFALLVVASVSFVAIAFAAARRSDLPRPIAPSRGLSAKPPSTASAPIEQTEPLGVKAPATPAARNGPVGPSPALRVSAQNSPEAPRARSSGPSPSAELEQVGLLKITADPPAQIELRGPHVQTSGRSPMLGLRLSPGTYQIIFRNDTSSAPLQTEVRIVSGASRSVHADFRQAEPAVSVR